jgi:leucyl-tRNA synthetase
VQIGPDGMHADTVQTFIETLVKVVAPICPHWADHVFCSILKAGETVVASGWPALPAPDFALKRAAECVDKLVTRLRSAVDKKEAPPKKKSGALRREQAHCVSV